MVKRFALRVGGHIEERPAGGFVRHNDYADMEAERDRYKAEYERVEAELARWRDVRPTIAEIMGFDAELWPSHGNVPLAVCSIIALFKSGQDAEEDCGDLRPGDRVLKTGGEYNLLGVVRAVFPMDDDGGRPRVVVRHTAREGGMFCHIYRPDQLIKQVD